MEKMKNIKIHMILCHGDFMSARQHTMNFFAETMLLNYDKVEVVEDKSCSAANSLFWSHIESGISQNKKLVEVYLRELEDAGCRRIADLGNIEPGYPSKVLHILAHLMDGFIGIDSVFYNLPEDSHWLSEALCSKIKAEPDSYWLLQVRASFQTLDDAVLVHK